MSRSEYQQGYKDGCEKAEQVKEGGFVDAIIKDTVEEAITGIGRFFTESEDYRDGVNDGMNDTMKK